MAARLVTRRQSAISGAVERLRLSPVCCTVRAGSRTFADSADPSQGLSVDVACRPDNAVTSRRRGHLGGNLLPSFFDDVFDPFRPMRSLSDVFSLMDQIMDIPFGSPRGGAGMGFRRGWEAWEEDNALYIKIDMPGLSKEDVKVRVDGNTLIIKGEAAVEDDVSEEEANDGGEQQVRRRYSSRLDLPETQYDLHGIKAEMKNGVLKVVVPKVKEEERKDVRHVQIE